MKTSVLIADDHPIFRRGLRDIIEETHHFFVLGEVSDGAAALAAVRAQKPSVVLLDIAMPKVDGLQVLEQLGEHLDKPRAVMLTMHNDYVGTAMRLGAAGYLLKERAEDELISCLDAVVRGERFVCAGVHWRPDNNNATGPSALLTPSERRIFKLIGELKTSREIGELLSISHRTVQNHRVNMCRKLGIQGDKALLRLALRHSE